MKKNSILLLLLGVLFIASACTAAVPRPDADIMAYVSAAEVCGVAIVDMGELTGISWDTALVCRAGANAAEASQALGAPCEPDQTAGSLFFARDGRVIYNESFTDALTVLPTENDEFYAFTPDNALFFGRRAANGALTLSPCRQDGSNEDANKLEREGVLAVNAGDAPRGLTLLEKAASLGSVMSLYDLGMLYYDGVKVQKDLSRSLDYMLQAACLGLSVAVNHIGVALEAGAGIQADIPRALLWYQRAAAMGNSHAMFNIARLYTDYPTLGISSQTAFSMALASAQNGHADGMNIMGYFYENGIFVKPDASQAAEWFRQAAEAGSTWGMYNYALHCAKGTGIKKNSDEALCWWQKAAEAGHPQAMSALADMYRMGTETAQDRKKAEVWYRASVNAGYENALFLLGLLYEDMGRYSSAADCYRQSAESGAANAASAMYNMGCLYWNGTGFARNKTTARDWFQRAADAGIAAAEQFLSDW